MKRSGKWYRKNEAEVMRMLGLKPTPNSGSGWIVKEDGENEKVLCQLKSTDAASIKVNKLDIDKLEYNSAVAHKVPVFAIQFIQSGDIYLIVKPSDLKVLTKYLDCGNIEEREILIDNSDDKKKRSKKIKSSAAARQLFNDEESRKYKKEGRAAK